MIHFHFITLFPQVISLWLDASIPGRARKAGLFDFTTVDLREFGEGPHRTVDDVAYGGGGGMVLKVAPLAAAVESLWNAYGRENCAVVCPTPSGAPLGPQTLDAMGALQKERPHLILPCGHYEGFDQRFLDLYCDREISLGDFVVTGGELPALCLADALIRQQEGALGGRPHGAREESFSLRTPHGAGRLLEYPQYTRPAEFQGRRVPDVLLSGDHEAIAHWRLNEAIQRTQTRRPDLLGLPVNRD